MNETSGEPTIGQSEFERISALVKAEFQVEESLMEHGIPTYHLKQPQETKQAFLRLLGSLDSANLIAILRRIKGKVVLRVVPKPAVKPSNILINWLLFLATIATTFATGYWLSGDIINPMIGGATFTISMLAVLGLHEMGHKITAERRGIQATSPYFIPGPPPFGTFGALIMQKSLAPNRDALFDVGANGPLFGFIIATVVSFVGLTLVVPSPAGVGSPIQLPLIWLVLIQGMGWLNLLPQAGPGQALILHPVTYAGWVGIVVTMLNLLPAGMLDGGHVARSIAGEKLRYVLTAMSVLFLLLEGFIPMAIFVVFLSIFRHPGPLDDVSGLSTRRKLLTVAMAIIFVLCILL